MPKFEVILERRGPAVLGYSVTVEADTEEEALSIAEDTAPRTTSGSWEIIDFDYYDGEEHVTKIQED